SGRNWEKGGGGIGRHVSGHFAVLWIGRAVGGAHRQDGGRATCLLDGAAGTMIAFLKGVAPILAVEIGRRTVPGNVRPSFKEVEEACRGAKEAPAAAEAAAAG